MISLNNISIFKENEEQVVNSSMDFEAGIHYLDYTNKQIFNLLSISDSTFSEGQIQIDGISVFPKRDKKVFLGMFKINSSSFAITTCLIGERENEKNSVKEISKRISELKSIVPSSSQEIEVKFDKLLNILKEFNCSYVLFDSNNKPNSINHQVLLSVINKYATDMVFVLLKEAEKALEIENDSSLEAQGNIIIDKKQAKQEEIKKETQPTIIYDATTIKGFLFKYWSSLFFIAFSTMFTILFASIYPYLFNPHPEKDIVMAVVVLVVGIVCFAISVLMIVDFLEELKHKDKVKALYVVLFEEIVIILGIGLGFLALFLFGSYRLLIDLADYRFIYALSALIIVPIYIAIPLLNKYVLKLFDFFKLKLKLLKKKK